MVVQRSKSYVQHVCTDVSRSRGGDLQEVPVVAMAVLVDADGPHDALPAAHSGFGCAESQPLRPKIVCLWPQLIVNFIKINLTDFQFQIMEFEAILATLRPS